MNEHVESLYNVKSIAIELAIKFGPKVLTALVVMVAGYYTGRWVGKVMVRGLRKFDLEPPVRDLLVRIVRILVLSLFAIMALQNLGIEMAMPWLLSEFGNISAASNMIAFLRQLPSMNLGDHILIDGFGAGTYYDTLAVQLGA